MARQVEREHGHVRPVSMPVATPRAAVAPALWGASGSSGTPISPIAFGADPTGQQDSTAAFKAAMAALLNTSGTTHKMASGGLVGWPGFL